jgi:RNA polymerase sigma-B factor
MRQGSTPPSSREDRPPAPDRGTARARRREETDRLLQEAAGRPPGPVREELLERVIRLNMVVAAEIARRYHGRGIPGDDLDQVANLGLVKAVRGFDAAQGNDFLSFAVPTIRGEIRRYFRDFGWTIRPPRAVQELQTRIAHAEGELFQELGRSPRPTEVAAHLDVDLELVLDSLSANGCFAPASLDAPVADGESSAADRLGDLDPSFASAEARVVLGRILGGLSERDRKILEMRFFGGCTQAEIGAEIGVTQMQVSRLLARLLTRLRRRLETEAA